MPSCDAASLMSAAASLQGIPESFRKLIIIYLLQQKAGLGALTPAQLVSYASGFDGISETELKQIEVALLCAATGGVPPCASISGGGGTGCSYQDMQVAWTPPSAKLNECMAFTSFGSNSSVTDIVNSATQLPEGIDWESDTVLQSLAFPLLASVSIVTMDGNTALASLTFPSLTTVTVLMGVTNSPLLTSLDFPLLTTVAGNFTFPANGLTSINLPVFLPTNGKTVSFSNNALPAAMVNHVLARCVANPAFVSGTVLLGAGSNEAPTGQGLTDKATLRGRGVIVSTA